MHQFTDCEAFHGNLTAMHVVGAFQIKGMLAETKKYSGSQGSMYNGDARCMQKGKTSMVTAPAV